MTRRRCKLQPLPSPAMTTHAGKHRFSIDANGCLTQTIKLGGQKVVVHYDDLPDSDITTVRGLPVTTALRTVIDLAPELSAPDLGRIVAHCLERELFTVDQALARIAEPDMTTRPGAQILLRHLLSR
jgi:hypothetical protein